MLPIKSSLWILATLTLTMTGCLSGQPTTDDLTPTDSANVWAHAASLPWGLHDCDIAIWAIPVDAHKLAPYVPRGFSSIGIHAAATLAPAANDYIGVEIFSCQRGTGIEGPVPALTYGSLFTRAAPPPEHDMPAAGRAQFVKWDVLIPDEPRRIALADRGLPVHDGHGTIERGPGPTWRATIHFEGLGTFTATGSTTEPTVSEAIPFAEYTATEHGLVRWNGTAEHVETASGLVRWTYDGDAWPSQVLPTDQGSAILSAGSWSFNDASINFLGAYP